MNGNFIPANPMKPTALFRGLLAVVLLSCVAASAVAQDLEELKEIQKAAERLSESGDVSPEDLDDLHRRIEEWQRSELEEAGSASPGRLGLRGESSGVEPKSPVPPPEDIRIDHPVVDEVGVVSPSDVDELSETLFAHREETGVQMAVLFVETTGDVPIEDYSMQVAEKWEGGHAERNDGVLLTFAVDDQRNRLELGYGIEPLITDRAADAILDDAVPALRAHRYGDAAGQIVDGVIDRTGHLSPAGPIRRPLGQRAKLFFPLLFLFALIHAVLWRHRRDELYEPGGSDYADLLDVQPGELDDDDDDRYDVESQDVEDDDPMQLGEEKEPFRLADVAWWAIPAVVIVAVFWSGHAFWRPYLLFWAVFAFLTAFWTAHARLWAVLIAMFVVAMPLLVAPLVYNLVPADGMEIFSFWGFALLRVWVITWYIVAISTLFSFVAEAASDGSQTYGSSNNFSSSSGGFSSSGSSGFSSSGGFSGGGGSFGGGGASGGW